MPVVRFWKQLWQWRHLPIKSLKDIYNLKIIYILITVGDCFASVKINSYKIRFILTSDGNKQFVTPEIWGVR